MAVRVTALHGQGRITVEEVDNSDARYISLEITDGAGCAGASLTPGEAIVLGEALLKYAAVVETRGSGNLA